jgi:hypothetical protein
MEQALQGGIAKGLDRQDVGVRIAIGFKPHSGWSALVAVTVAREPAELRVVDRRRIDLFEPGEAWAKQPYHAAERRPAGEAVSTVERGVAAAYRGAEREVRSAVERLREAGHEIAGAAVLGSAPMPDWTTEQILSVHFRMHRAEGALFPAALARAIEDCGVNAVLIPSKELLARAAEALEPPAARWIAAIAALGKAVGPPWGADQKNAALAALVAFTNSFRSPPLS